MNKCVYIHKTLDNIVFYVGCGSIKRANSNYKGNRNKTWNKFSENGYTIEIIKENLTQDEAYALETKLIYKYGRIDNNTGTLVNKNYGIRKISKYNYKSKKIIDLVKNKKVIDIITNVIYDSIEEAALANNLKVNFLIRHLEGLRPKNINLKYLTIY